MARIPPPTTPVEQRLDAIIELLAAIQALLQQQAPREKVGAVDWAQVPTIAPPPAIKRRRTG